MSVALATDGTFASSSIKGCVAESHAKAVQELLQLKDCSTQAFLNFAPGANSRKRSQKQQIAPLAYLSIIIHGKMRLFDGLGDGLQEAKLYLQDPVGCDHGLKYRNPHRLDGLDDDVPLCTELSYREFSSTKVIYHRKEMLAGLDFAEHLSEASNPTALATMLKG